MHGRPAAAEEAAELARIGIGHGAGRRLVTLGAVLGLLAVAFGAFGTHALRDRLTAEALATFETGARYQMYHALALLVTGALTERLHAGWLWRSGRLFTAGIVIFCGSLYGLALGAPRWFGVVAPLGGICLLSGWLLLAVAAVAPPRGDGQAAQRSTQ